MDALGHFEEHIRSKLTAELGVLGFSGEVVLERPDHEMADLALPCFQFAKQLRKAPPMIAQELSARISADDHIGRVWADKGYINFRVNESLLSELVIRDALQRREEFGKGDPRPGKVLLEHTSVNPTGPIHVGRARNPLIGDTLARCLRMCGHDVSTEYYVNDVGKQVVLLTWALSNLTEKDVPPSERQKDDHRLVGYYQAANKMMESSTDVANDIAVMTQRFEAGDPEVIAQVRRTVDLMLDGIKESLGGVNVFLDRYTYESQFILDGSARAIVERLKASSYAEMDDGAYFLNLEEFGVHGRDTRFFFTRKDGTTLYTTRDLAYHMDKFRRADELLNILGEDQKLGQKQLASALKILGSERSPECIYYSFVSLPEGRMSTRKGVVVYLDDLLEEAVERAYQEVCSRRPDLDEEKKRSIARDIGVGAVRYNIIRVQAEKQLIFKWEEALNFEGALTGLPAPSGATDAARKGYVDTEIAGAIGGIGISDIAIDADKNWNGKNITNLGKISPVSWLVILGGDPLLITKSHASSTTVTFAQIEAGHGNVKVVVKGAAIGPITGTRTFTVFKGATEIWSQAQASYWDGDNHRFAAFSATAFEDLAVATGDVLTISRTGGDGAVTVEIYATPCVAPYGIAT